MSKKLACIQQRHDRIRFHGFSQGNPYGHVTSSYFRALTDPMNGPVIIHKCLQHTCVL